MNKFEVCSQASVLCGGSPLSSFEGETTESQIAQQLYEAAVRELLGLYRWRFSTTRFALSRDFDPPITQWEATYQLPNQIEALNVHGVFVDDGEHSIDFDRFEGAIQCNAGVTEKVSADITYRSSEEYWPAYFETCLRYKLAALFAIPIAEDESKSEAYESRFIRAYAVARNLDAQSRTAKQINGIGGLRRYHRGRP